MASINDTGVKTYIESLSKTEKDIYIDIINESLDDIDKRQIFYVKKLNYLSKRNTHVIKRLEDIKSYYNDTSLLSLVETFQTMSKNNINISRYMDDFNGTVINLYAGKLKKIKLLQREQQELEKKMVFYNWAIESIGNLKTKFNEVSDKMS